MVPHLLEARRIDPSILRLPSAKPKRRKKPDRARSGSVSIPVYKTKWRDKKRRRTYTSHVIIYRDALGEHREKRASKQAALDRATEIATSIANGQVSMLSFSQEDKAIYKRASELIFPTGKPLELAAGEYAETIQILRGLATPAEAARFYVSQHSKTKPSKSCPEIFQEMLRVRRQDGAAQNTLDDYESRLGRFVKDFTCPIQAITTKDLDDWLTKLPCSKRTRNNYRGNLVDFYRFARRREYIEETWNPLAKVPKLKNEPINIVIFTPEEIAKLLAARSQMEAEAKRGRHASRVKPLLPYLAIAAFAGVRNEEMCAPGLPVLEWRDIDLEQNEIKVRAAVARKKGRDRITPIQPNLAAWLKALWRPNGPICDISNVVNALLDTAGRADIKWKDNGLRKSFISYRLALVKDIGTVADEAGTSPDRIRHNYRKVATPREARRWFDVGPALMWKELSDPAIKQIPLAI